MVQTEIKPLTTLAEVVAELDKLSKYARPNNDSYCEISENRLTALEEIANELRAVQDAHAWLQEHARGYSVQWDKQGGWWAEFRPMYLATILYSDPGHNQSETAALLNLVALAKAWHAEQNGGGGMTYRSGIPAEAITLDAPYTTADEIKALREQRTWLIGRLLFTAREGGVDSIELARVVNEQCPHIPTAPPVPDDLAALKAEIETRGWGFDVYFRDRGWSTRVIAIDRNFYTEGGPFASELAALKDAYDQAIAADGRVTS